MKNNQLNESLVKSLLLMKYNTKKTLEENKKLFVNEQLNQTTGGAVGAVLGTAACYTLAAGTTIATFGGGTPLLLACAGIGAALMNWAGDMDKAGNDLEKLVDATVSLGKQLAIKYEPKPSEGLTPSSDAKILYDAMFNPYVIPTFGYGTNIDKLNEVAEKILTPVDLYLLDKEFRKYGEGGIGKNLVAELDESEMVPFKDMIQVIYDNAKKAQKKLEEAGLTDEKIKKGKDEKEQKRETYKCTVDVAAKFYSDSVAIPSSEGDGYCLAYYNSGTKTFDSGRLICFNTSNSVVGKGFWTCSGGSFKVTKYQLGESQKNKLGHILSEFKIGDQDLNKSFDDTEKFKKITPTPDGGKSTGEKKIKKGFSWKTAPSCEDVSKGNGVIEFGMKGTCVGTIQKKLNEVNKAGLVEDEKFGKLTKGAVESFQTKNQISPSNGVVDKKTYEKLFTESSSIEIEEPALKMENRNIKKIIKEETTNYNLRDVIDVGCLDGLMPKTLKSYEKDIRRTKSGKEFILGTSPDDLYYFFYNDGTFVKTKYNETTKKYDVEQSSNWSCDVKAKKAQKTGAATKESQNAYIIKLKSAYPQYETSEDHDAMDLKVKKGEYKKIDLNGFKPEFFPEPGKYFVYEKVASQSDTYKSQVLDYYTANTEYTLVDCETPLTNDFTTQILDLSKIENGKYSKVFLPNEVCIVGSRERSVTGDLMDESKWEKFLDEQKKNFDNANVPKKLCRQTINGYATALDKELPLSNKAILPLVKEFIKKCSKQHTFHAGTKNDLNKILYSSKKNRPGNDYAMKEENLSNVIRKNLVQLSEQKKNFTTETTIVKNRLDLLRESIGKKKNNRRFVFNSVVNEVKTLKNQGISDKIISEQFEEFFNALGGFFGKPGVTSTITGGIGGTFVEYAAEFIIKMLGIPAGSPVAQLFITAVGNVGSFENIPRMLTECDFTAGLLAKSIVESIAKNYVDDYIGSGFLADALRNTLTDAAFNTDLVSGIQKNISGKVCEIIGQLGDKAGEKAKEMKDKALS